jgi:modulator of FtsH protease
MSVSFDKQYVPAVPLDDSRQRVLRNTYWLLALTMIPTVLGAVLGVMLQIPVPRGFLGFGIFLAAIFGFQWAIHKNNNSGMGVVLLLAFTFFMGIWLTPLLTRTLGFSNGGSLIMLAFGGTAAILAGMATIATVTKRDFSMMGKWLFAGMIALIVVSFAAIAFQLPMLMIVISALAIVLFSFYILYDVQQIVNGGQTNYISAATMLYIDVFSIFSNLLALLGIGGGSDD